MFESYPKDCRYCEHSPGTWYGKPYQIFHKYDAYCILEIPRSNVISRYLEDTKPLGQHFGKTYEWKEQSLPTDNLDSSEPSSSSLGVSDE